MPRTVRLRPLFAVCAAAAALLPGCAADRDGGEATPVTPGPPAEQPVGDSAGGPFGVSPSGVTTRIDLPAESTEEQYAQACMATKEWMDARGGDPDTLVEPFLQEIQAGTRTGAPAFGKSWSDLTDPQRAAVIIAVQAAADGGC